MKTECLSSILHELRETRMAIYREIEYMSETLLHTKPKRETWSIMQMLHHLHLVEQAITTNIAFAFRTGKQSEVQQKVMSVNIDYLKIPETLMPTETIMKREQILHLLEASRSHLIHVIEELNDEQELWIKALPHPMFGELALGGWLEFHGQYEKHYLKEIQKAKRALGQYYY